MSTTCFLDYCDKPRYGRMEVCQGHNHQKAQYGREEYRPFYGTPSKKCDAPWCDRLIVNAPLCLPCNKRRNRYGLTHEDYLELSRVCAVCNGTTNLHVDHDHVTGIVRGVLCQGCNTALGILEENKERIMALAAYLG